MTKRPWDEPTERTAPAFYRQIVCRRALHDLAPEMAELILRLDDGLTHDTYDTPDYACKPSCVPCKLRQIGVTDD